MKERNLSEPATPSTPNKGCDAAVPEDKSRKSRRLRSSPSRYIARPSQQGLGVEEGDAAFLACGRLESVRQSKRLIERQDAGHANDGEDADNDDHAKTNNKRVHASPVRDTRHSMDNIKNTKKYGERKQPRPMSSPASKSPKKRRMPSMPSPASKSPKKNPVVGSGAPRRPRVIIIGAGISGLACARELSERRHDVLVLEARNRIGGRCRTVDLMLDKEWKDNRDAKSDLYKVQKWSPVDVGGAFIHGTGVSTSDADRPPSTHVGSHDFGTSSGSMNGKRKSKVSEPIRKSARIHTGNLGRKRSYKNMDSTTGDRRDTNIRRSDDGIGGLNPLYVLARQKLRLPVHAAEGAYTCLVDHNGNLIGEEVDRRVAKEFNEVLDLATKCCEQGRYEWKDESAVAGDSSLHQKQGSSTTAGMGENGETTVRPPLPNQLQPVLSVETGDVTRSPNYVSDDTTPSNSASEILSQNITNAGSANISPETDFGEIFAECKRHHDDIISTDGKCGSNGTKNGNGKSTEQDVCDNLFRWHVANLEMSSGAPIGKLGQRWNDDEPFGYGGDHSYLEGGLRDVIETLAEGFECRGIGDRSTSGTSRGSKGNIRRRSGDFASTFGRRPAAAGHSDLSGGTANSRGIIQCGIEVNGVKVIESEEAKLLRRRKRKKQPIRVDNSALRRSNRENRGEKMATFLDALTSRPKGKQKPAAGPADPSSGIAGKTPSIPISSYGNKQNSSVQVTTKCGLTFEADAVIVTTPLAILSIPSGSPGHISFSPPLPLTKQNALSRLGVGAYNKCCMSFEKPFWNSLPRHLSTATLPGNWADEMTKRFDFIGHASAEHGKDILFFNLRNAPVVVAIYGGSDYSEQIEGMHDGLVVLECMTVLKKICSKAIKARDNSLKTRRQVDLSVPNWPIDYFVSRWGSDPYSRGAFSYVPAGVNGFEELRAMSTPICDFGPKRTCESKEKPERPLIMFAGEATTPYHPSTMHGAFESGIREAYRLDLALEPELNGITFDEAFLYRPTFSVRRAQADPNLTSNKVPETASQNRRNGSKNDSEAMSWWFDHDASILRGVETFGYSAQTMSIIKKKLLAPASDNHSEEEMLDRYKSLMHMITNEVQTPEPHESNTLAGVDSNATYSIENEWSIPGQRGTWLVADVAKNAEGNISVEPAPDVVAKADLRNFQGESTVRTNSGTRRSSRKSQRKLDESFTFY
mmetsp:Transcript_25666/g.53573  ORF Transcript_25666/g.53573 Transcript_25666/m.53573 type:complete len:1204 (+) Transcript_25666:18-3629(+)